MADYATLTSWIKSFSHREDLDDKMAMFLELAHNDIVQRLDWQAMEREETLSTSRLIEAQLYAYELPDRFFQLRSVWVNGRPIPFREPGRLRTIAESGGGEALAYSIVGEELWLAPGATPPLIVYRKAPAKLDAGQVANEISAFFPNLYLYSGLAHLHRYVQDGEEEQKAWDLFNREMAEANRIASRQRTGSTPAMEAV